MGEPLDRSARIQALLGAHLAAVHLQVVDESHLHVGHAGAASGAGHFRVVIVSERFEGKSAIERQRLVYDALSEQMGSEIHALSMQTLTPEQWRAAGGGG